MRTLSLMVFLLGAWLPGSEPARAGDPPQPPPAVARDIEILNRMLQQRRSSASTEAPPSRTPPSPPQPSQTLPSPPTPAPAPASRAVEPAAERDGAGIAQLIAALDDEAPGVREKARGDLVQIGGPAVPDLIIALENTGAQGQIAAATALGAIKDARAAEPLVELLDAPPHDLRVAIYRALSGIGPPAVPAILDALTNPADTERQRTVRLLGDIGDPGATETLVALLGKDPSTGVRVEIAAALGRIKDRAACDALLDALHDW